MAFQHPHSCVQSKVRLHRQPNSGVITCLCGGHAISVQPTKYTRVCNWLIEVSLSAPHGGLGASKQFSVPKCCWAPVAHC